MTATTISTANSARSSPAWIRYSPGTSLMSAAEMSGTGMRAIFAEVSWRDPALSSASHAGLINNLNDGMAWGLFPLFFTAAGMTLAQVAERASDDPDVIRREIATAARLKLPAVTADPQWAELDLGVEIVLIRGPEAA